MANKVFRGVYAVSCTPFDASGAVDEAALRHHLRWLLDEGGVHGIIPAGSTGEFAFLSEVERRQVVEIAIDRMYREEVRFGTLAISEGQKPEDNYKVDKKEG